MPKRIENLQQRMAEEAWKQIREAGYSAMTIRSVAKACGVGVGTVYNYYSSKEAMVATFMLESWKECVEEIRQCVQESLSGKWGEQSVYPRPVIQSIYDNLQRFIKQYEELFHDEAAVSVFYGSFSQYHGLLRSQLADPLRPFCRDDFMADFVAESMLTWTVAGRSFEELDRIMEHIF